MPTANCPPRRHLTLVTHRVTEVEFEDDTAVDPSRTFPAPRPKLCKVCAGAWAFVLVSAIAVACTVVRIVLRLAS